MNKQQASEFLGVSARALERYTKNGRVSARYEKGRTKPTPVYDEEELQAFKATIQALTHSPAVIPPDTDNGEKVLSLVSQTSNLPSVPGSFGLFIQALNAFDERMLTVAEAAVFSGISQGALHRDIKAGLLNKYEGYGRGYRVKRSELRSYMQGLKPIRHE